MKKEGANKWDIYYIYGTSSGYIQQYSTSTSDFFRPRPPASDEKNPRSRGYIVGYSPPKPNIYITHIYNILFITFWSNNVCPIFPFFFIQNFKKHYLRGYFKKNIFDINYI